MKKVLVVSHERSGTYLLTETIAQNFGYGSYGDRIDLDGSNVNWADPEQFREWLRNPRRYDLPLLNPFKSHHAYCFFEPVWDEILDQFHVFYVYRNGLDVMCSFWNHINKMGNGYGPHAFHPRDFFSAIPLGAVTRYDGAQYASMAERWGKHVLGWMETRKADVCYISYEDMVNNFEHVVEKIALHFVVDTTQSVVRPSMGGVHPWRGKPGAGTEYFNQNDVNLFNVFAGNAMRLLGYV